MVPEGRSGGWWSFPRSVLVSSQCFFWHSVSGQHCLERQAVSWGRGWDLIEQNLPEEGMGGMRPVQQVGGRALSACRAQTSNNSVIKSWDIIYHAGPFLQTQMFEHEGVQLKSCFPVSEIISDLPRLYIQADGACCSHKEADTVLNILFVFQRPSGCISSLFEKAVTLSVLHYPKNALCWESE